MKTAILIFVILLFAVSMAMSQEIVLKKYANGRSGGVSTNGEYAVHSTSGLPVIGTCGADSATAYLGMWFPWSVTASGVEEEEEVTPKYRYELKQNFPNPFNPVTTIPYSVGEGSAVTVTLRIYDVSGALVKTLVSENKTPGAYEAQWNGDNNHSEPVASGIYFYRIKAGQFIQTRKLVLLK